jgi:predicted Rossmann fold nucleotide-binding protein DprA/Smf involved in DNA uptake
LTSAADVLASFGLDAPAPEERGGILDLLPASADELVRRTGLTAAEIAQALIELELVGAVAAYDGLYRAQ